ncbi:MAG: hypothetical protein AAFX78_20050, partial [Cyanobacteria bacterium J06638_20]
AIAVVVMNPSALCYVSQSLFYSLVHCDEDQSFFESPTVRGFQKMIGCVQARSAMNPNSFLLLLVLRKEFGLRSAQFMQIFAFQGDTAPIK